MPYLKQQCQYVIRSFDIITNAHFQKLIADPEKASHAEFKGYFDAIKQILLQRRGVPKEQQIRELLAEYYRMVKQILLQRRGVPKEQQIRELLAEYYRMVKGPQELVVQALKWQRPLAGNATAVAI